MFEKVTLLLGFPELGQVVNFESHLVTIMTGIRTFNHLKSKRQVPLKRRERERQREGILNREVDCLPTPLERIADDTKIVHVCVTNHETNGQ